MGNMPGIFKNNKIYILSFLLLLSSIGLIFLQPLFTSELAKFLVANAFQFLLLGIALIFIGRWFCLWFQELGYRQSKKELMLLAGFSCLSVGAAFFYSFFQTEQDIKVYDYSMYWTIVIESRELIAKSIFDYLIYFQTSLAHDYSYTPAFPLLPFTYLFGLQFSGYTFSVFLVYYLPACLFLTIFALRLVRRLKPQIEFSAGIFTLCFIFCLTNVCLLWPVLHGYLDICGVLVMAIFLNFSLDWDCTKFNWKINLVLVLLTVTMVLLRRWYAFFIVGAFFAFAATAAVKMLAEKDFSLQRLAIIFLNMISIAASCALCFYLLNSEIFISFFKNYAELYSAYKSMTLLQNVLSLFKNLGAIFIPFYLYGIFLLLKSAPTRFICIRLLVTGITVFLLFYRVQDMNYHHYYLVLPTILIIFCVLAAYYTHNKKILFVLTTLSLLNFAFAYLPSFYVEANKARPLTTYLQSYPVINPNYDNLREMALELKQKTVGTPDHIYIGSDSDSWTPELLRRAYLPDYIDFLPAILFSYIVDVRDGFPSEAFLAQYILISDPYLTDFAKRQQVSYQLYDLLLYNTEFSSHYQLVKTYPFEGYKVLLFEKIKPIDAATVDILKSKLESYYPDNPFVYEPNYFIALFQAADQTVYTQDYWVKTLILKSKTAIEFTLNDTTRFSDLSFTLSYPQNGPNLTMHVANQNGVIFSSTISEHTYDLPVELNISGSQYIKVSFAREQEAETEINVKIQYDKNSLR